MQLQKNDGPKKQYGTPNPLNIEWTRNAKLAGKREKNLGKFLNRAKWRYRKTTGQKKNRTLQIHSTLSGHEVPKIADLWKKYSW